MNMRLQTLQEVVAFIWLEADLLDHRENDAWLDLWDEKGKYIVPIDPTTTDFDNTLNYANDDHEMRKKRVFRLRSGESVSTTPPPRTLRTVSRFRVLADDGEVVRARCAQNLREFHKDSYRFYSADLEYELARGNDGFKILKKVIRLINSDDAIAGVGYIL
jgi:3-phenylpropionate/cinnamic acid dioxygenase small subunit